VKIYYSFLIFFSVEYDDQGSSIGKAMAILKGCGKSKNILERPCFPIIIVTPNVVLSAITALCLFNR